jgi:hypothetical protein
MASCLYSACDLSTYQYRFIDRTMSLLLLPHHPGRRGLEKVQLRRARPEALSVACSSNLLPVCLARNEPPRKLVIVTLARMSKAQRLVLTDVETKRRRPDREVTTISVGKKENPRCLAGKRTRTSAEDSILSVKATIVITNQLLEKTVRSAFPRLDAFLQHREVKLLLSFALWQEVVSSALVSPLLHLIPRHTSARFDVRKITRLLWVRLSMTCLSIMKTMNQQSPLLPRPLFRPSQQPGAFAPPGPIGIVVDTIDKGCIVHSLKKTSPMQGLINPGDLIVALDDFDVREMDAASLTKLMAKKSQQKERKFTLIPAEEY